MVGEIMESLVSGSMDDSYSLDRASALVFCMPGRYVTVKSKRVKNKDHLCLPVVESLGGLQIFQVAMIGQHCKGMFCSFKPMTPLLKSCLHS